MKNTQSFPLYLNKKVNFIDSDFIIVGNKINWTPFKNGVSCVSIKIPEALFEGYTVTFVFQDQSSALTF